MNSKVHDFIQKTLANDASAADAFREYVREKTRLILYPQAKPQDEPVIAQPELPKE